MKNDYEFWNKYLNSVVKKLEDLILKKKKIYCDFHIHSNYSIDSTQSLEDIIKRSIELGLDVVSITDHDNVDVYDELYNYLITNKKEKLIIIPGVEFTIHNKEYGNQFHILQLMINPKSKSIINDVNYQKEANWIRIRLQFNRIKKNNVLQSFINEFNINYSIQDFKKYLNTCFRPIPEYATIMNYLLIKFKEKEITNWQILEKMEIYNSYDKCVERKKIKEKKYNYLKEKYINVASSDYNFRFFHSLLAVKGADDDFFPDYDCMGDLSVNNYNELTLEELNKDNLTIFAHPSDDKLYLLKELLKLNENICGIEFNKQSYYKKSKDFFDTAKQLNLSYVIGSDSHTTDSEWYNDMDFYCYSSKYIKKIILLSKKYIDTNSK